MELQLPGVSMAASLRMSVDISGSKDWTTPCYAMHRCDWLARSVWYCAGTRFFLDEKYCLLVCLPHPL